MTLKYSCSSVGHHICVDYKIKSVESMRVFGTHSKIVGWKVLCIV